LKLNCCFTGTGAKKAEVKKAVRKGKIQKIVYVHTLRYGFVTYLSESGMEKKYKNTEDKYGIC